MLHPSNPLPRWQPLSPQVRLELTTPLFDGIAPLALISVSYAAVAGVVLHLESSHDGALASLYVAGVAVACSRIWLTLAFQARRARRPVQPNEVLVWERLFGAGSMTFGAILGLFSARTLAIATPAVHELTIALLLGYGAGLVARMSLRPWISVSSLALAVLPPLATLFTSGALEHAILAALLVAFALGSVESTVYIYRAVRAQVQLKHHLDGLARHDPLTGLANRRDFDERLLGALASHRGLAVHCLDLDRFKPVNDRYGHAVGDALLKAVGGRLAGLLREGDIAARVGGDEFVVLQLNCSSAEEAGFLARRIVRAVNMPFDIAGHDIRVGASVGVAVAPQDGTEAAALTRAADAALYRAKNRGRSTFVMALTPVPALAS